MLDVHQQAENIVDRIEAELKALQRWESEPLAREQYEDMGAFGSNTMSFVQWLQFVLIPRIREIVREREDLPDGSMLAAYAIREFDGDPNCGQLHDLLYELDELANGPEGETEAEAGESVNEGTASSSVALGDTEIPPVLFTLAGVLPEFEGEDLEGQLQTFDMFLGILSPAVRPAIGDLLRHAAAKTSNASSRARIEHAARAVADGGSAAAPHDQ